MLPTGVLHRRDGRSLPFWRRHLDLNDVDAVFALHRRVIRELADDLVATETREFFCDHVERKGRLLGLFTEEGLVAYAVLGLPGLTDANFGTDHHLPADQLQRVAHLDGASVDFLYRGNGLQRLLLNWRLAEARMAGRTIVLATAAPGNTHSLDNALACRLQIRGLMVKFGGWRYLLRRDQEVDAVPAGAGQWLAAENLSAQEALLRTGWRGWLSRQEVRREILFAPALERPAAGEGASA